jgi:hypothetical protein
MVLLGRSISSSDPSKLLHLRGLRRDDLRRDVPHPEAPLTTLMIILSWRDGLGLIFQDGPTAPAVLS